MSIKRNLQDNFENLSIRKPENSFLSSYGRIFFSKLSQRSHQLSERSHLGLILKIILYRMNIKNIYSPKINIWHFLPLIKPQFEFFRLFFCLYKILFQKKKKHPRPDFLTYGFSETYVSIFKENVSWRKSGLGCFQIFAILCQIFGEKKRKFQQNLAEILIENLNLSKLRP